MRVSGPTLALLAFLGAPGTLLAQGEPLGPEFRVNTYTTSYQGSAAVASDSSGGFVVVWRSASQYGFGDGVFAQRYAPGGAPLGSEFRVNTYTPVNQRFPAVASDPSGNFVVAWTSYTQDGISGLEGVFAQRFASTGAPLGPEFHVNTYTTGDQIFPAVASDAIGNVIVAWESQYQDGSSKGIFARRYANTGTPLGGEFAVNTYTTGDQITPAVAADPAGNFVVAWESEDGSGEGVFAQRYSNTGSPLGGEFRVNTLTTDHQRLAAVAADAAGNFVIVWERAILPGNPTGVFGQRFEVTGAPLGAEFQVSILDSPCCPSVTLDPTGNFVITWQAFGPRIDENIYGQRYSANGNPLGGAFQVNTYTPTFQANSSVAADSAGNFVVAWVSNAQDGSYIGIYGQRFGRILPVELLGFRVE